MLSVTVEKFTPTKEGYIVDASDLHLLAGNAMPATIEILGPVGLHAHTPSDPDFRPIKFRLTGHDYHGSGEDREIVGWRYEELGGSRILRVAND